ncbi:hypothetical protein AMS68_003654 [Peltaster fructicola]|uniref:DNA/RNA-binding protein Alba-like domain-containing protein n=1 Tax=Peltaster fructicola TaxID=286661 RepID=A0A6H0XTP0_9PEZI|nr:hypothetical protein AMS68_003654 [Peltaster fructicola]
MANSPTLSSAYDVFKINVRSSTQITNKATAIIAKLAAVSDGKIQVVVLEAQAQAANKMISIVEIAKRELKQQGTSVFQYTTLESEMSMIKRRALPADELEPDNAFDAGDPMKKRAVPLVTIYLCRQAVKELRHHAEQID